jgi:predicted GNAT superfamily acetyltransferase
MGQICVDAAYRGQGIFRDLYHALKSQMEHDFDFVVTEVSDKNQRSVLAHQQVGFRDINDIPLPKTDEWEIIAWDWS